MKLWFDTDPGVDDALALALLARSPGVQCLGVSTVFGNADVATTTRNAQRLLPWLGLHVPLHAGAAAPLAGAARWAPEVHGGDGLGGCAAQLPGTPLELAHAPAAQALVQAAQAHAGQLHVVAVGPLTNIALALRVDGQLPQRLASLTVMGGAFGLNGQGGNVTPCAEANVHNDVRAAAEVFAAPWASLRIVGLEATHAVRIPRAALAPLQQAGAVGAWLWRAAQPYVDFYAQCYGEPVLVAHDATALLAALHPDAFQWRSGAVRVVEGGLAHGQSVQDWQGLGDASWRALPRPRVAVAADAEFLSQRCLQAWTTFHGDPA